MVLSQPVFEKFSAKIRCPTHTCLQTLQSRQECDTNGKMKEISVATAKMVLIELKCTVHNAHSHSHKARRFLASAICGYFSHWLFRLLPFLSDVLTMWTPISSSTFTFYSQSLPCFFLSAFPSAHHMWLILSGVCY